MRAAAAAALASCAVGCGGTDEAGGICSSARNCQNLDPPTDSCEAVVTVFEETERVRIELTPGAGCTIEADPPA